MKELCVDARWLGASGIGTYIKNILPALKTAFSLKVVADEPALKHWEPLASFDLIFCPSVFMRQAEEQIWLPLVIPRCDLFWSPHYNVPLMPIRAKKRLVTIHDANRLAFRSGSSFLKKVYVQTMIKRAVKSSDQIITDSRFSAEELEKLAGAKKEKVDVVHLGVVQRNNHQKPATEKFFLFVSNILPHKNLEGALKAFRLLLDRGYRGYRLRVVGQRVMMQEINQLLKRDPELQSHIDFLDRVEDAHLEELYRTAIALVFPSFYEGFGLPPLEAMSFGCPVIASHVASLPEVCGSSAEYVDPHNSNDIVGAMIRLITDDKLREKRAVDGLERSRLFSWTKTVERHIEIMERLA